MTKKVRAELEAQIWQIHLSAYPGEKITKLLSWVEENFEYKQSRYFKKLEKHYLGQR